MAFRSDFQSEFLPRRRRRRIFWYVFSAFVILVVVLGGFFYAVRKVSWFNVARFEVAGTSLPTSTVVNAVKIAEIHGWVRGALGPQNILFWQFGRQPNVALSLPFLASLNVETDLFARTVKVTATDRTLWAIVCETGGDCYGVDASGTVFAAVPQTQGSLILQIADQNGRTLIPGEPFLPSVDWLRNFMTVLNTLQASGYPVVSVTIDPFTSQEWHALLASGVTMDFSFAFAPDNFRGVLANLPTKVDMTKVTDVDFSVPQRIYYK